MLPDELIAQLNLKFQCRNEQIRTLAALYGAQLSSPPFLNIYGLTATGKTSLLRSFFQLSQVAHTFINVRECITPRHLLERIIASSLDNLSAFHDEKVDQKPFARTESVSALCVNLGKMLEGRGKFVLVLDALDKLREGGGTLIPALARLHEVIPNLSLIGTTTLALTPSMLHSSSTLFLQFPPYNRTELFAILGASPPKIFLTPPLLEQFTDYTPDLAAEDDTWLWGRFIAAVYDSLSKHTGRDLLSFTNTAIRLWRPFVEPIITGQFGTRDFSRLMVNRRHLFQLEDAVLDCIITQHSSLTHPHPPTTTLEPLKPSETRVSKPQTAMYDLPYYTTHLLIAAYLASYNPSRTDTTYFMKHTDKRKNKRRAPSIASLSTTSKRTGSKHRKISRHLLTPSPFALDRLFAIFRALLTESVPQVADLLTQVATLNSLRLLVRVGGVGSGDVLEGGIRWRVSFGWEFVRGLGRRVGIEVGEYLVGGVD